MKFAINSTVSTYPDTITGGYSYWPLEQPAKVTSTKCFNVAKAHPRKERLKVSEDGYDSSHSTSAETSDAELSTGSVDLASFKSMSEQPEPRGADMPAGTLEHLGKPEPANIDSLSWVERANLILPVIAGRVTSSLRSIAELQRLIAEHPATKELAERRFRKKSQLPVDVEQLRGSFKDLQIQELVEMMTCKEAPVSVQIQIDTLAFELQQELTKPKRGSKTRQRKRQ